MPRKDTIIERFWAKADRSGGSDACWSWLGARKAPDSYGRFTVHGKPRDAHRVAWELFNGPIPKGQCICHRCDNPGCVNPAHLFIGTQAVNVQDAFTKGRLPIPPRQDHRGSQNPLAKLTEADVLAIRRRHGAGEGTPQLALAFGVQRRNISRILSRERWSHV